MKRLFDKERRLAASPLSFVFMAAALLAFVPSYPILLGAFFTTLGLFYSFQTTRENNDILYSLLLPIAKADVVKGKFLFAVWVELCSFVGMAAVTAVRMLWLSDAAVYVQNALMGANLTFLGWALLIFGLYNLVFIAGFFKTAYKFGKPFLLYCVLSCLLIGLAETLPHLPGMEALGTLSGTPLWPQGLALLVGAAAFAGMTAAAFRQSVRSFEKIDL